MSSLLDSPLPFSATVMPNKTGRGVDVVVDMHIIVLATVPLPMGLSLPHRFAPASPYSSLLLLHHAAMPLGKLVGFFSCLRIRGN